MVELYWGKAASSKLFLEAGADELK